MQWEKEEKEEFIHVLIKFYAVLEECIPGDSDAGCPISEIGGEKVTLEKACGMGLPEL